MTDAVPVSMGRGSNKARLGLAGLAQFINYYVEDLGEAGKTGFTANAVNGWQRFATLTDGGVVRTLMPIDTILLGVAGRLLFSTNAGGAPVNQVGGIPTDGLVVMRRNRKTPNPQVAIVCDGYWGIYEGGTLTTGTDPDLPPPIWVEEIDGYFIFLISDGRWFIAGPNEGSEIDPLDFAEAEASSDGNVGGAVRGRTLLIMGSRSVECWDPNGDPDFPFSRTTVIDMGCYAAGSIQKVLVTQGNRVVDTVAWAATDHTGAYTGVVMLDGYVPAIISTGEVDRLIRDEPNKTSIRSMSWTEDAHPFYAISGSTFTMVWDGKTGEWHRRRSAGIERWRASCVAQFAGKTVFGSYDSNKVYESLPTLDDEDGAAIIGQIQPPPIHMFPHNFLVQRLHVDMVTGVGLNSTDADKREPELVIDYSRDGGASWGPARRVKIGAQAQYHTRISESSFGRFDHHGLTLRLSAHAAVTKCIQQLAIAAKPLRAT